MGENTKIQWCDHTFNPWRGCTKVASGCANCYAEEQSKRNTGTLGKWGPNGTRVVAAESAWKQVEKWDRNAACVCDGTNRPCELCARGYSPAIFCGSMCDVFEDWPGVVLDSRGRVVNPRTWRPIESEGPEPATLADVRARVFGLIDATRLTWLLLTKRIANVRPMWPTRDLGERSEGIAEGDYGYYRDANHAYRRDNVWLGTSIACQEDAERNIPELLKCRDLCRGVFLSIEPLVGPVDISEWLHDSDCHYRQGICHCSDPREHHVDQVIVGGESGPHARPCRPEWIRSLARQCDAAGVLCHVKQLGANVIDTNTTSATHFEESMCWPDGTKTSHHKVLLRDKKGGDTAEWPEDLRKYRRLAWKGGGA